MEALTVTRFVGKAAELTAVRFDASMYFRFGSSRRPGVTARTCFDAVVSGERTSTTRFESDSPRQFQAWSGLKAGDVVRIWSGPWRARSFTGLPCLIAITATPQSIDLTTIDGEAWSQAEGWSPAFVDVMLSQGKRIGLQVRYRLHTPPSNPQMDLTLDAAP